MKYLTREDRQQIPLFVGFLEEAIDPDNEVRLIDAFVEALPLGDFGFKVDLFREWSPCLPPSRFAQIVVVWLFEPQPMWA